jgi:hypothetical protein
VLPNYDTPPVDGKCKGHDVSLWFPRFDKSFNKEEREQFKDNYDFAVSICESCDVSDHCLEYSLRHEPFGIWGGKNEAERVRMRAKRSIPISRDERVFLPGIGLRSASGVSLVAGQKRVGNN